MKSIDLYERIDLSKIDRANFFADIVNECINNHIINEMRAKEIENSCMMILENQIKMYLRNNSTSIKVEIANKLLSSVFYVLGYILRKKGNVISCIKECEIRKLFDDGVKLIKKEENAAKILHNKLKESLFETSNIYYNSTIIDGINSFFKIYTPKFFANEIYITVDYRPYLDDISLDGIEYIHYYLNSILKENEYCNMFNSKEVHYILCSIDENYEKIPMNIYEYVLATSLGCMIVKKNYMKLELDSYDIEIIKNKIEKLDEKEIEKLLLEVLKTNEANMKMSNDLIMYVSKSIKKLAKDVMHYIAIDKLDKIFLEKTYFENDSKLILSSYSRIESFMYEKILDEVNMCDNSDKKAEIILTKLNCITDIFEIVKDAFMSYDEIKILVSKMSIVCIAAFYKEYSSDNFIQSDEDKLISKVIEEYIESMPEEIKEKIIKLSKSLLIE